MEEFSAKDVAAFMLEHLEKTHSVYQSDIVLLVHERFGDKFVYINENGSYVFIPSVLTAFKKLAGDKVVWCRLSKYWRLRMSTDDPTVRFSNE